MSFDLRPMVYAELISEEKIAESLADTEFQAINYQNSHEQHYRAKADYQE